MIRLEFHCHTEYSKDSRVTIDQLIATAKKKQLDKVIVTDHNRIDGAMKAGEKAPEMIVVGEEIMTTEGELLAAFVKEPVPPGLDPQAAIMMLREQGSFISVSHPFDSTRSGAWRLEDLIKITPFVDAIEGFNSRCLRIEDNELATDFARDHSLPCTVGSDAHSNYELGRSTLILPDFSNTTELIAALQKSKRDVRISPFWVHFISTWAKWSKKVNHT